MHRDLDRQRFLRFGGLGLAALALDACGSTAAPLLGNRESQLGSPRNIVTAPPGSCTSVKAYHGELFKFGYGSFYCYGFDCFGNIVASLTIYTGAGPTGVPGQADFWVQGKGTQTLYLTDQRWTTGEVVKIFDKYIKASNNGAKVFNQSNDALVSDAKCDPTTGVCTTNYYPTVEAYSASYLNVSPSIKGGRLAKLPHSCLSARLNYGAACIALTAACMAAELGPLEWGAIVAAAMYVASAGLDMQDECR